MNSRKDRRTVFTDTENMKEQIFPDLCYYCIVSMAVQYPCRSCPLSTCLKPEKTQNSTDCHHRIVKRTEKINNVNEVAISVVCT